MPQYNVWKTGTYSTASEIIEASTPEEALDIYNDKFTDSIDDAVNEQSDGVIELDEPTKSEVLEL